MFSYQPFLPETIFQLDLCNLDSFSENFTTDYYLKYMLRNPGLFLCATSCIDSYYEKTTNNLISMENRICGYILGYNTTKMLCIKRHSFPFNRKFPFIGNGKKYKKFSGVQIFALSVSFYNRRMGVGNGLVYLLKDNIPCDFLKLFVRTSNVNAIKFYRKIGFIERRTILGYYSSPVENAYELVKPNNFTIERDDDILYNNISDEEN